MTKLRSSEKEKINNLKKLYRYETQFEKLGIKKGLAAQKALAEAKLSAFEQAENELERQRKLRAKNKRGFLNSPFWSTNVFGRAFSYIFSVFLK